MIILKIYKYLSTRMLYSTIIILAVYMADYFIDVLLTVEFQVTNSSSPSYFQLPT